MTYVYFVHEIHEEHARQNKEGADPFKLRLLKGNGALQKRIQLTLLLMICDKPFYAELMLLLIFFTFIGLG